MCTFKNILNSSRGFKRCLCTILSYFLKNDNGETNKNKLKYDVLLKKKDAIECEIQRTLVK